MKDIDPVGLIQAVVDVHQGRSILDPEATARVMRMVRSQSTQGGAQELSALSAQERRVLALVAAGKTNKEIAVDLKLSDNTVKNYLGSVFEKLQVKRRSQAAAIYVHVNSGAA
jgi:DNA-binding NarL/FixJ family response regulator